MAQRALTVKQRKFVAEYLRTGNGTQAALVAYDTADRSTARAIAAENLAKPAVHQAVAELLEEGGLSDRKLTEIHAHYLALYRSDDPREKAIGLKSLDMLYKLKGAYAPERHQFEARRPVQIEQRQLERLTQALREVAETEAHPRPRTGEDRPFRASE